IRNGVVAGASPWTRRDAVLTGDLVDVDVDGDAFLVLADLGLAHLFLVLHGKARGDRRADFREGQGRAGFDAVQQADEIDAVGTAHRVGNPTGTRVQQVVQAGGHLGGF